MVTSDKHGEDANIVSIDEDMEPIEATIVDDSRSSFGKRLGVFAIVLIFLFFVINGYVQAAKNARLLDRAIDDRSELVESVSELSRTVDAQSDLIRRLQAAIREQNEILRESGIETVPVPIMIIPERPSTNRSQEERQSPQNSENQSDSEPEGPEKTEPEEPGPPPEDPDPDEPEGPPTLEDVQRNICELTGICP